MAASIPQWINEEHFVDVLKENLEGFKSIEKFRSAITGGPGENYQSVIVKVEINAKLQDGSTKDVSFMVKTLPQFEQAAMMLSMFGHFPKENLIYSKYLPAFEKIYQENGEEIVFGPKHYTLQKNPETEYVILNNLCLEGFENVNRIEGLDKEHTEAVLKKLAKFHAASAVQCEKASEELEPILITSAFNAQTAAMFEGMLKPSFDLFVKGLSMNGFDSKYIEKSQALMKVMIDRFVELATPNPDDFNVICHGDLWSNNIMFLHEDIDGEKKLMETRFIDFQLSRYNSPAIDLYYFLLTSPQLDIKVAHFDDFIKYYHENLVENLKRLGYSKELPSLKYLQMDLLKKNALGFMTLSTTCAGLLLDPSECGDLEDFLKEGEAADKVRLKLYNNPRYVELLKVLLPWMDSRGFLDL